MNSTCPGHCGARVAGCLIEHVLRSVGRDHSTVWQSFEEHCGDPPGSTTGIDHGFVTSKIKASDDSLAPIDMWTRNLMVDGGVPLVS